jgi:hypothetical protein
MTYINILFNKEHIMINIKDFEPKPTIYKAFFRSHGISVGTIANYLGRSYPYVCNVLNGNYRMPSAMEKKLQRLVNQLEEV